MFRGSLPPDALLAGFLREEKLPSSFTQLATTWYWPLIQSLAKSIKSNKLAVIGISGSQGSGKSTLAALINATLRDVYKLKTISLSLDDFYLTRSERESLAHKIHPLFITRGVPGTHDISLALSVVNQLLETGTVRIPRFDKAMDDRKPLTVWDKVEAPVDAIILEGWCLAVPPQSDAELEPPLNILEKTQDGDSGWRAHVNKALAEEYTALFQLIDYLIYLQAPGFAAVKRWRLQQEQKLASTTTEANHKIMATEALDYFLQHYQRLTQQSFNTLPKTADITFVLDENQTIVERIDKK